MNMGLSERNFKNEIKFITSRSSGPGGQSVNKLNTKVELRFDILNSVILSVQEKEKLIIKLKNKINKDGILQVISQSTRSMIRNKEICYKKFILILENALVEQKKRKKTKIPLKFIRLRLKQKRQNSEKKQRRKYKEE